MQTPAVKRSAGAQSDLGQALWGSCGKTAGKLRGRKGKEKNEKICRKKTSGIAGCADVGNNARRLRWG